MQTPYYEINERKLNADISLLQNALREGWGDHAIAACSVKTNSLPWLLTRFRDSGFYAEVVSAEEYDLVKRLGFAPSRVIYNGPIKDRAVFEEVLLQGGMVNLDSSEEPQWLEELADDRAAGAMAGESAAHTESAAHKESAACGESVAGEAPLCVGLRVNVNFRSLVPSEVPADEEGSRFGYCEENGELEHVIGRLRQIPGVRIAGLHLHSSTKSRSVTAYAAAAAFAVRLAKKYGLEDLSWIDMGGGYYGGVKGKPDFRDYVPAIAGELKRHFDPEKVSLVLEPGVSMVSSSFSFVTSVRDVKRIQDHVYVVTDGSRVNLNPQVTRRWYPHHFEYQDDPKEKERMRPVLPSQMICGATCMEYDRLFEEKNALQLQPGDRVVYDLAGGYTVCLTPLFIHYFPAVLVQKEDGTSFLAREPWTNDEFLAKNHWESEKSGTVQETDPA